LKEYEPGVVGVPVIAPVAVLKLSPGGSDPSAMLHFRGAVPPLLVRAPLYAAPTVPEDKVPDIVGKGFTVMLAVD